MFIKFQVIIFIVAVFCLFDPLKAQTQNYCNTNLCRGKPHIACNNSGAFASACGKNAILTNINISAKIRNAIVRKHNELRNRVAQGNLNGFRPAMRMATIRWDNELANLAALNVKQCIMNHDKCRSTSRFRFAGQNLAKSTWSGMTRPIQDVAVQHIQMWFNEHKFCSMPIINYFNPTNALMQTFGHFTLIVQEKNSHVGCAILRRTVNNRTTQLMACNYSYTNAYNQPVYRRGVTGSRCTTGRNATFKGLCSVREVYNLNKLSY